mgnify:CR=1 FL=1
MKTKMIRSADPYTVIKPRPTTGDSGWFTQARFGLFMHWGLYAQAARHEWVQNNEGYYWEEEEYH